MLTMSTLTLAVSPVPHGHDAYCAPGNKVVGLEQDGPAVPLQQCFYTNSSATPARGDRIPVKAGDSLIDAWNSAKCGDVLMLDPEGVWEQQATEKKPMIFEAKNCDEDSWIWIRSAAPDSSLPPEGTRR